MNGVDRIKEFIKSGVEDGITMLMWASKNGYAEVVKLLIEEGSNLDMQDKKGRTALMLASRRFHTEVVSLLIRNRADVDIICNYGGTALMHAIV